MIDTTKDALPLADMIFCKDCLRHLSYQNARRALRNFVTSGAAFLLTTSYPLTLKNRDICDGDYHALNLRKAPFNLPAPLEKIHETSKGWDVEPDKTMFLYRIADIRDAVMSWEGKMEAALCRTVGLCAAGVGNRQS